jgi:hypothetical protein
VVIAGQGGGKDSMLAMKGLLRLAQAGCHVDAGIVAQEQGKTMKEGKRKREKAEGTGKFCCHEAEEGVEPATEISWQASPRHFP